MGDNSLYPFYGRLVLKGLMRCETGLHIGASRDIVEIGGVDNPVMRDPLSGQPYIPGSSFKGKLRSIAERVKKQPMKRWTGNGFRHECSDRECEVCRLFGSTAEDSGQKNIPSRIRVRDILLTKESEERLRVIDTPLNYTELKYENSLDRVTCAANPRPVERIPAGAEFEFEVIYDLENEKQTLEDLENLLGFMAILEDDYLGGHGSRGYGKISFINNELTLRSKEYYVKGGEEKSLGEGKTNISGLRESLWGIYKESIAPLFRKED